LNAHPNQIYDAWQSPLDHPGGALFQHVTPNGSWYSDEQRQRYVCRWTQELPAYIHCGCITQVRAGRIAYTPELTADIRADNSLPDRPDRITLEHLPRMAEWQRKIDRAIRGVKEIQRS
jgi:hypothetical protein